jgi:hypothetical protein
MSGCAVPYGGWRGQMDKRVTINGHKSTVRKVCIGFQGKGLEFVSKEFQNPVPNNFNCKIQLTTKDLTAIMK